ncbi:hypothetical protein OIDMADRAFT_101997 [Oidiodendron maius Zn]|uniref:F-box domain-containing protein n=1 Tax=Oidiodendron maius (strain Zn) TaxID=913774 RepID=A0A0C3HT44_OIDMZ|nr:hypothetical protein OIDMADRAFT_101997 [Oidiodendron maius Zn]
MAEYVNSTRPADSPWPGPDDWPGDSFQKIIHELKQIKCKVESLHGSMREVANASSRSRIRPLKILDLPDELLRKIFANFRNQSASNEDYFFIPDFGNWGTVKDIKNIRLTCRRFCNTSSHLLLRHIDVAMSPSSLAHLEEVACHPLLSKGIQAVRVHLNYFSVDIATNILFFSLLAIEYLEGTLDIHRFEYQQDSDKTIFGIPPEKLGPAIEKAELISEAWSDFLHVLQDSDRNPDIIREEIAKSKEVAGLASAHKIYRQKYLAQESLLKEDTFVRAVVTAMSKMPTAKRLFVGDTFRDFHNGRYDYVKPFVDAVEDLEGLAAAGTVWPQSWDVARSNQLDDQPKEILLQLLLSVFNNGIPINYLCVELSPATELSIPATKEQLQQLTAGTERLRVFDFRCFAPETNRGPTVDHGPEEIASLGSIISACMGGKALRRLDVDLDLTLHESGPQPPASMGSLLALRQCPDLRILQLSHYPLHVSELKTFLIGLNGPLQITLESVLLLSGTWAEALDLIRAKTSWGSVTDPRGAECDDMSEEEIQAIFGERFASHGKEGKATQYVLGYTDENPLRTPESAAAS